MNINTFSIQGIYHAAFHQRTYKTDGFGTLISLPGNPRSTTGSGVYWFSDVPNGEYVIRPLDSSTIFSPPQYKITLTNTDPESMRYDFDDLYLHFLGALNFLRNQMSSKGLLDSFVEDGKNWSFTYDNALAAMAFISAGDLTTVETILDALSDIGPESEGGFLHRYTPSGGPSEGVLVVGHNAYVLQAMNLYFLKTGDPKFNLLAQGIADYLLSQQDTNGGLFLRDGDTAKSTENNLAAYTAIHNLGVLQEIPFFRTKANEIQNFLITEIWDGKRFLKGEKNFLIATDVQALGALILGALDWKFQNGVFWVEFFTVTTQMQITGFDLNIDRDTVWTEGSLQASLAFALSRSKDYARYKKYKSEVEKLIQNTGGLWESSNTGTSGEGYDFNPWTAVAPTAWYILVYNQDNVLEPLDLP